LIPLLPMRERGFRGILKLPPPRILQRAMGQELRSRPSLFVTCVNTWLFADSVLLPAHHQGQRQKNALTGTACLYACCVCLSCCSDEPSWVGGAIQAQLLYCCSAFHSSIVQVRSWREGKPKGRSLVTDQSTPNTTSSVVGVSLASIRVKRVAASLAVVSHNSRVLSRGIRPLFALLRKIHCFLAFDATEINNHLI
jgi:hypothetical protein